MAVRDLRAGPGSAAGTGRCMAALNRAAWFGAVLLLAACANTASNFVAAPPQPEQGYAVYLYRPSSSSNFMYSPRVVIDGDEQFSLGNGDYRYVYLQPGEHTIGLGATGQYTTGEPTALQVEAGSSYYLRVRTQLRFEQGGMNTRTFWLEAVDEKTALSEIGATKYAGPKSGQSPNAESEASTGEPGFSVDNTQDPFAGKYR